MFVKSTNMSITGTYLRVTDDVVLAVNKKQQEAASEGKEVASEEVDETLDKADEMLDRGTEL